MIWNLSQYINFFCVSCSSSYIDESYRNFKTRIEKHIKMITGLIFVKHLHSTFSCFDSYNSVCFEITEKGNSILDLKIKKSLHISWRKYNCTTKSFTSHPFTMASVPYCFCLSLFFFLLFSFLFFSVVFFGVFLLSIIFIIIDPNYRHLSLSYLHFVITSCHYSTPCITSLSFIYCFHYLHANYRHFLQS